MMELLGRPTIETERILRDHATRDADSGLSEVNGSCSIAQRSRQRREGVIESRAAVAEAARSPNDRDTRRRTAALAVLPCCRESSTAARPMPPYEGGCAVARRSRRVVLCDRPTIVTALRLSASPTYPREGGCSVARRSRPITPRCRDDRRLGKGGCSVARRSRLEQQPGAWRRGAWKHGRWSCSVARRPRHRAVRLVCRQLAK